MRPGLVLKVLNANITSDGTITTRVRITDPQGLALDPEAEAYVDRAGERKAYVDRGIDEYRQ